MVEPPTMLAVPTGCVVRPGDLAAERDVVKVTSVEEGLMSAMLKL